MLWTSVLVRRNMRGPAVCASTILAAVLRAGLIGTALVSAVFAGCGSDSSSKTDDRGNASSAQPARPEPASVPPLRTRSDCRVLLDWRWSDARYEARRDAPAC
jgi:hypothetical protein